VYTTDELRDRFQSKPGSNISAADDQKVVVPNLKRRNSAPPGMIHFPPGTFSAGNSSQNSASLQPNHAYPLPPQLSQQTSPVPTPHHQHELVTHARSSPTSLSSLSSNKPPFPYSSRLEKRRASLPYIPPSTSLTSNSGAPSVPPSIEAYLTHLQQIPLPHQEDQQDEEAPNPPLSPTHPLPSFQSLLQTIREDADEEDAEILEIEERAKIGLTNGTAATSTTASNGMQSSKSLPYKDKSPQQSHHQQDQQSANSHSHSHSHYQPFATQPYQPFPTALPLQEPLSPSSKFYKSNLSRSNDNLPSLSRMSISDILG
jgi:hypothetical protein